MSHEDEYHDGMIALLELIWGEGFMAPGGPGNVAKMVEGLSLDEAFLDITGTERLFGPPAQLSRPGPIVDAGPSPRRVMPHRGPACTVVADLDPGVVVA